MMSYTIFAPGGRVIGTRALLAGLALILATVAEAQHRRTAIPTEPTNSGSRGTTLSCTVQSIADGDSFTCADRTRVRLLLIDAPERSQAPFGASARRQLLKLLPAGTVIRLEPDVQRHDRYGRLLAYAYLADGRMANEEMARAGYVMVLSYPPNIRHIESIRAAVQQARNAKRGLWSTSAFDCSPRDYRQRRC